MDLNLGKNITATDPNRITTGNMGYDDPAQFSRRLTFGVQHINPGAAPRRQTVVSATGIDRPSATADDGPDWRVGLKIPNEVSDSPVFTPFSETGGRMIFPVNPTVILNQTANYQSITPTHTNYAFHAYQNSQVQDIVITGDFFVQNEKDAKYWVASLHFLRTMTKMYYGSSDDYLGNPPLLSRLSGYGSFVLNNIPVLITNFTTDMVTDVDYIPCDPLGDGNITYVPTQSQVSVTCVPNYSRRTHSQFNFKTFANGGFANKDQGFV